MTLSMQSASTELLHHSRRYETPASDIDKRHRIIRAAQEMYSLVRGTFSTA